MSCPHGFVSNPATCSQCLGIPARRVTLNEDTGELFVGGEPTGRGAMFQVEQVKRAVVLQGKTCRHCGIAGHKEAKCYKVIASQRRKEKV